jgi:hypothetical protein
MTTSGSSFGPKISVFSSTVQVHCVCVCVCVCVCGGGGGGAKNANKYYTSEEIKILMPLQTKTMVRFSASAHDAYKE